MMDDLGWAMEERESAMYRKASIEDRLLSPDPRYSTFDLRSEGTISISSHNEPGVA
jgi:hypothetical protein